MLRHRLRSGRRPRSRRSPSDPPPARRRAAAGLVLLASLALPGCGGSGGNGGFAADDAAPGGTAPPGGGAAGAAGPDTSATVAAAGAEVLAVFATNEGDLYRVAADGTGLELVHALSGGWEFVGTPDVVGTTLYVGSDDNAINAIDLGTGRFLWDVPIGEYRDGADDVSGTSCLPAICVIAGDNGVVLAVDPATGRTLWAVSLRPDGDPSGDLSVSTPLVAAGRIWVGAGSSSLFEEIPTRLFALDLASGTVLASRELALNGKTPQLAGGRLVVGGAAVAALDPVTLETLWSVPTRGAGTPAVVGGTVVAHLFPEAPDAPYGTLIAGLDLATGAVRWTADGGSEQSLFAVATDGRLAYAARDDACAFAGCRSGDPIALDPATGRVVWESPVVGIDRAPTVAGGRLFYADINDFDSDSGAGALDVRDGSALWIDPRLGFRTNAPIAVTTGGTARPPWAPPARP